LTTVDASFTITTELGALLSILRYIAEEHDQDGTVPAIVTEASEALQGSWSSLTQQKRKTSRGAKRVSM
jgi:hypothetical protein